MPDLLNFSVTAGGAVNINAQRFTIECKVVDSADQSNVLADFTGANALVWPGVLATLTPEQRRAILDAVVAQIIDWKAGV